MAAAVAYPLDANHLLVSTPTKTEFYTFSPEAIAAYQKKNAAFTSNLKPNERGYKVTKLTAAEYLQFLQTDSCIRSAIPEILHNALDGNKKYGDLGNDTKATRVFVNSGIERLKAAGPNANLAELYTQWEQDFLAREHISHARSELASWELFTRREANPRFECGADLHQEMEWSNYEKALLGGILKRLEEVRRFDKQGLPKQTLAPVIPVTEMPDHAKTEFYTFSKAAVDSFKNRTRPYQRGLGDKDQGYKVQLLQLADIVKTWEKDGTINGQKPDILENASNLSKPFHDLGITTKKVRVFQQTGLERVKGANASVPLADLYTQWEQDFLARELHGYVRSELLSWESVEQRKANPKWEAPADYLKESQWVEYENAFLKGVLTRLDEIRRADAVLTSKRDEVARQEAAKAKVEADKAAREADKLKKLEEEKNKKAAEEEKKKKQAEEAAKKQEEQNAKNAAAQAEGANKIAEQQKKMAAYQAEMAELQGKMAKGEIDGAAFGAAVGGLSKKYFG